MHESVDRFQSALLKFEEARKYAETVAYDLKVIGRTMSSGLNEFLAENYGMKVARQHLGRDTQKYRLNMKEWPDAEKVNCAFEDLARAFNEMHSIWQEIPQEDRSVLRSPNTNIQFALKEF